MKNNKEVNNLKNLCIKIENLYVFLKIKSIIFKFVTFLKNNVLALLLMISIYCVIRYSELPVIPFIPKIITDFFIKPNPNTNSYEAFRLLENLSLAYIASYIFYLIIDYFPNKKRAMNALELVKGELKFIHFNMGDLIKTINAIADIPESINNITLNDLHKLDEFVFSNETLYFNRYSIINGDKKVTSQYTENFYSYSNNNINNIVSCIRKIKSISCALYINFGILEILSSIETNWFLSWILNLEPEEITKPVIRMGFSNDYYQFIQSYKNLSKLEFVKKDIDNTEIMDETQIINFKRDTGNFKK